MKINILIIVVIVSGNLVITASNAATQVKKNLEHQISQHSKIVNLGQNPNIEDSIRSKTGSSWGLHESLKNCVSCHSTDSKQLSPDKTNLAAPIPALCYTCHEHYVAQSGWIHGPVAAGQCMFCHAPHKTDNEFLLNKPIPELCYDCHEQKTVQLIANHADESYSHCNVCHAGHISESRMLLKNHFLNADEGLIYINKDPSHLPRPVFVDRLNSLVGLQGIEVVPVIDGLRFFKRYGVKEDLLKSEIERQLQQNSIKILNYTEKNTEQPSLQVYLRLMEVPSFRHPEQVAALSGSFNIFLQQKVELLPAQGEAKKRYCTATTWDTGAILIWGTSQIEEGLKEAVRVLVGRFIKDYLAANPRIPISSPVKGK